MIECDDEKYFNYFKRKNLASVILFAMISFSASLDHLHHLPDLQFCKAALFFEDEG